MIDMLTPGNILLPANLDYEKWSVIACDQFTSQPEYWENVDAIVGSAPSTLRLMLPEVYLNRPDTALRSRRILSNMKEYLSDAVFRVLKNSYVYVERTLSGGGMRRGILGLLDLEAYDYRPDAVSPVHATEGLVIERIPPRLELRREALIESPHLILFYDDAENAVNRLVETLPKETIYDFPLMCGGGRIKGSSIGGQAADTLRKALNRLSDPGILHKKYGRCESPVVFAVGDGNHSLATARKYWEDLKPSLSPEEQLTHPARYTLAELVNLHEPDVEFEPIHRVLFDTDPTAFLREAYETFGPADAEAHSFSCLTAGGEASLSVKGTIGQSIAACERFVEGYIARHGGHIDYIHGMKDAEEMAVRPGCAALLMPEMRKSDLFPSIIYSGILPKKSFSIGPALDKRYYLECRCIKPDCVCRYEVH